MIDYTRAKLFAKQNNLKPEQVDELISIIQDIEHAVLVECAHKLSIANQKKSEVK